MIEKNYGITGNLSLRIALISDIHNTRGDNVIESLQRKQPDLICIAGDIVHSHILNKTELIMKSQKHVRPFLSACAEIAPTYMSLGNHERMLCDEDLELIAETGVQLLDNTWIKRDGYVIGGLTSAYVSRYRDFCRESGKERYAPMIYYSQPLLRAEEFAWLDAFEKIPGYRILLSHHPEYWSMREPFLINRNIDLILSGHAHGGQFRLFGQGFMAPGQGWFPKYTSGIHRGENGRMIISKGLANTVRPIPRLFNPTEIVYVDIQKRHARYAD